MCLKSERYCKVDYEIFNYMFLSVQILYRIINIGIVAVLCPAIYLLAKTISWFLYLRLEQML
jgi:hypothetical protein